MAALALAPFHSQKDRALVVAKAVLVITAVACCIMMPPTITMKGHHLLTLLPGKHMTSTVEPLAVVALTAIVIVTIILLHSNTIIHPRLVAALTATILETTVQVQTE